MAAPPEHHRDGAERQQHYDRGQDGPRPDPRDRGPERSLGAIPECGIVEPLVTESLHGLDRVYRLLGAVGHIRQPVLAETREPPHRSEEHTSELQSLMRISY